MMPTDEEVLRALNENATKLENGNWTFGNPLYFHPEQSAKNIVRICLILGLPVSDIGTSEMFLAMVNRIVAIESRLGE